MKKEFCDICGSEIEQSIFATHFYYRESTPSEEKPRASTHHSADLCERHGAMVWKYINILSETKMEGGE